MAFCRIGPMFDCSRNAVLNLESIQKLIHITARSGYTTFMLYLEDVYEIEGEPYFGHGRGRYTQEELRTIDAWCKEAGLEFIPCIQTLAHLDCMLRWPKYVKIRDFANILLVGEEETYALIEKMFQTMANCVSTRILNVGMDEAHMVGHGKYYNLHGHVPRSEVMMHHVQRVAEIAEKYGFTITVWSDMFYRLASTGGRYSRDFKVTEELRQRIPSNVELVYWEYLSADEKQYDAIIRNHEKMKKGTWFAGAMGSCRGYSPVNANSILNTKAALRSCKRNGIQNVMMTSWGDDGGECSRFSFLPSLFFAGQYAQGNTSITKIRKAFQEEFKISWDAFMSLDLISGTKRTNASKYMLYNDLFGGLLDTRVPPNAEDEFAACARRLSRYQKHETWGYLFTTATALCRVLEVKANLGNELRAAYQKNDREALTALVKRCKLLTKRLQVFYRAYRNQWYLENKDFGFEVQDIRIGGLVSRVKNCTWRLEEYLSGRLQRIEELEQTPLDYAGGGETRISNLISVDYENSVSAGVVINKTYNPL